MKQPTLFALLFILFFTANFNAGQAASAKFNPVAATAQVSDEREGAFSVHSKKLTKKQLKRKLKFEKKKNWLEKRLKKSLDKPYGNARNYLVLCLGLFLLSVVFFAIGGAIFNIFGSVTAIAAAVFFVLWLLEYTGTM